MELFVETGAWMIPTIYPITAVGDTPEKMKKGPFGHLPAPIMEKLLQLGRQPKDMGALAYKMGVKIALGTDSGVSPHGENANEFVEYVNIGMSNMEALMAGTINAAIAAGIEKKPVRLRPARRPISSPCRATRWMIWMRCLRSGLLCAMGLFSNVDEQRAIQA